MASVEEPISSPRGEICVVKKETQMNTTKELHVIFGTGPVGRTLAEELLTDEA
jgi:hypothetical protein